jgi:hypothetical protein
VDTKSSAVGPGGVKAKREVDAWEGVRIFWGGDKVGYVCWRSGAW